MDGNLAGSARIGGSVSEAVVACCSCQVIFHSPPDCYKVTHTSHQVCDNLRVRIVTEDPSRIASLSIQERQRAAKGCSGSVHESTDRGTGLGAGSIEKAAYGRWAPAAIDQNAEAAYGSWPAC